MEEETTSLACGGITVGALPYRQLESAWPHVRIGDGDEVF